MATYKRINAQCFVKRNVVHLFEGENTPELRYVSHVTPNASAHPMLMHSHKNHVELLLICQGESDFLIHNKKKHVRKGDLLIYNSNIVHDDVTGPECEIELFCVAIGGLHMKGLRENALIPDDAGYIFHTTEKEYRDLYSMFDMMFHNLLAEEMQAEAVCDALMHAILNKTLAVVNRCSGVEEREVAEPNILGNQIKEYIDEHYMELLTLESIGKALHISPYYLSHIFKEMSGYSPIQYLLRRRLGEAQNLLISTDMSITDIAGMVGFDTQSYFNAQFTKNIGMPPKKYRQNYLAKKEE